VVIAAAPVALYLSPTFQLDLAEVRVFIRRRTVLCDDGCVFVSRARGSDARQSLMHLFMMMLWIGTFIGAYFALAG
jgi:hypothetical protein